ncbi:hypothetical protein [Nostoc sp. CALU 546]
MRSDKKCAIVSSFPYFEVERSRLQQALPKIVFSTPIFSNDLSTITY